MTLADFNEITLHILQLHIFCRYFFGREAWNIFAYLNGLGKCYYYVTRVPFSPKELNDNHIASHFIIIHITNIKSKPIEKFMQGLMIKKIKIVGSHWLWDLPSFHREILASLVADLCSKVYSNPSVIYSFSTYDLWQHGGCAVRMFASIAEGWLFEPSLDRPNS